MKVIWPSLTELLLLRLCSNNPSSFSALTYLLRIYTVSSVTGRTSNCLKNYSWFSGMVFGHL